MPQPRNAKKSTGRRAILGLVLAARRDVQCNMLAEHGANKSDGWKLRQFRCGVVYVTSWWGTDAAKRRNQECAPKSSVVRT